MNGLLIVGFLIISPLPLYAQGQQPDIAKLKADGQRVVNIISGDKAKAQTYCQINNLVDQIGEAEEDKLESWPRSEPNWRRIWAPNTSRWASH
jgi:hypothetical protein